MSKKTDRSAWVMVRGIIMLVDIMLVDATTAIVIIHIAVTGISLRFGQACLQQRRPRRKARDVRLGETSPSRPSAAGPPFARYIFRSLPHMPEALILATASPGFGVGS